MKALEDIKKQRDHTAREVEKQKMKRKDHIEIAWELKKYIKNAEKLVSEYDSIIEVVEGLEADQASPTQK